MAGSTWVEEERRNSRNTLKIINKYLLREYLVPTAYCLIGFNMLQIIYDLFFYFSRFMQSKPPASQIFRYYLCYLTPYMEYITPASLLLATLYTLWRLSRHGELVAMRASGISLTRIMMPFLAVGIVFSLATGLIKEFVAPDASQWAKEFRDNRFHELNARYYTDQAYYNSEARRLWFVKTLNVAEPNLLNGVKITEERKDGTLSRDITAGRAEWLDGTWWLFDARIQEYNEDGHPKGKPTELASSVRGVEMPDFSVEPVDFVNQVKNWDFMSVRDMLRYLRSHPHISEQATASKLTDMHIRLALPWASLIVILFGIPAGAQTARNSIMKGILLTISFFFIFYGLTQVGVFLGKTGILTPWIGAWLSNVVFLAAGIRMLLKMSH